MYFRDSFEFMVAMDTSFGKRSLMINVKTKAIMKIIFAIFRIFQKFIIRQSEKKSLIKQI